MINQLFQCKLVDWTGGLSVTVEQIHFDLLISFTFVINKNS